MIFIHDITNRLKSCLTISCIFLALNISSIFASSINNAPLISIDYYLSIAKNADENWEEFQSPAFIENAIIRIDAIENSTDRIKFLNILEKTYSKHETTLVSLRLNEKALKEAEKNADDEEQIAIQLEKLAKTLRQLAHYDSALDYSLKALEIQRRYNNEKRITSLIGNISIIYRRLSHYDKALTYATELMTIQEKRGDINGMASAYNTTGLIYSNMENNVQSRSYFERTLALDKNAISIKNKASALRALADVYKKDKQNYTALKFANQALTLYQDIDSIAGAESVYRSIGKIYQQLGEINNALQNFELALKQARKIKNRWSEGDALIKIGQLIVDSSPKKAIDYAKEALSIGKKTQSKSLQLDSYEVLAKASSNLKNHEQANKHLLKQYRLAIEISEDDISKRIAELQVIRETKNREIEIEKLKFNAKIREMELQNTATELKLSNDQNIISALELSKERNITIIFIFISLFILLALAFLVYRYNILNQRQPPPNE